MVEEGNKEFKEALQSFVEITGTDEACARFFLEDAGGDIQKAIENFQEAGSEIPELKDVLPKKIVDTAQSFGLGQKSSALTCTMLSWNVDGLDSANLKSRFIAVCYIISKISPDIVFLQELTPCLGNDLREMLGGEYSILLALPKQPYFTAVLLKPTIDYVSHSCFPFTTSHMGRAMETAYIGGKKLRLLNTHLESGRDSREVRKAQLKECFDQLKKWDDNETFIIFGGDLNLRDEEVSDIPDGFKDAWIACGSNAKHKYTWDMALNDNKSFPFKARNRFDRIFFKCNGAAYSSVDFALEGQNRLKTGLCFPSDHWAVVVTFY